MSNSGPVGKTSIDWTRFYLALAMVLFMPELAIAAPQSTGDMFCEVFKNVGGMPVVLSGICYIAGAWMVVHGIYELIKHSSDPNKPMRNGILSLGSGAMVAALPILVEWLHKSFFKGVDYQSAIGCKVKTVSGTSSAPLPLDEMLANFVDNIHGPIIAVISAMAFIFGGAMIFYNMVKLAKFGSDPKSSALTPILFSLLIGAMLMAVGQTMSVSLTTLFGGNEVVNYSGIAYNPGGSFDMTRFNRAMTAVFIFLKIIGALSFVRGFFILKNAVEGAGQATKGQAFTHVIGGTLLWNMPGFIQSLEQSIGFKILA